MSQYDMYHQVFRDQIGIRTWIPSWRPGANLQLGMVGRIEHGEFVRAYDLSERGITLPDPGPPDGQPDEYEWMSEGGVKISFKVAGETNQAFKAVAAADVGFRLDFGHSDALAMVYRDVLEQRLGDERALAEEMIRSWKGGPPPKMEIGDLVITQVLMAGSGFSFGAGSKDAHVVLKGDAGVGPVGGSLADIKGKVKIAFKKGTSFHAVSEGGLAIGYRCLELKQKGIFRKETVAKPRLEALVAEEEDELVLAPEDLPRSD